MHLAPVPETRNRAILRWIMIAFYTTAGILHIAQPGVFLKVVPDWVPYPEAVVIFTGICELLGAIGLAVPLSWSPRAPALRWWAGAMLALYALCVFPANIRHFQLDLAAHHYGTLWYHIPRMPMQPVLIWWALYVGGVTDWPWRRRAATAAE